MAFPLLFKEGRLGTLKLKNRLVMPPMVRNYADQNGLVTPRYINHIERIARGGVGAMILEASYIRTDGKGFLNQLGIHSDKCIPGLNKLVEAAHKHGAALGIQLYHAGRQTSQKTSGRQPVAPSAIPDPTVNEVPRELSAKEIGVMVSDYAAAAARAKKAGFDFVEIHGAHGYLITQFLSPFSNQRKDKYGGSQTKRQTFMLEVYHAVRNKVGLDFPVIVRLSGDELVDGGLTIKDTVAVAKALEDVGVNGLHISAGNYASYARGLMIPPMAVKDGPLVHLAAAVKKMVGIPVIAVAKIRSPQGASEILAKGQADFVGIGRTLLADPDWPNKVRDNRLGDINKCIACNQGCISRLFAQQDVWCTVNPETGREGMFAKPVGRRKTVLIAGGGPAGLEAAKVAAERGHRVVLFEKGRRLGGQLPAAAAAPFREEWKGLSERLINSVKKLGVEIHLGKELTASVAKKYKADAAIVAIGSSPVRPKIPGIGRTNVVTARDVLEGKVKVKGKVVVAGGGCMGAQTAEFIAAKKHPVLIVEMLGALAVDAPVDDRALLLGRLDRLKVKVITETKIMAIGHGSVSVEGHRGTDVIPADTVVVCLGSFPNDGLTKELEAVIPKVLVVGDAVEARRVTDAITEGALAVLKI